MTAAETLPMGFTPVGVIEHATPDWNEVLVIGRDANDLPKNVLLRDSPSLRAQLVDTPRTNPGRAAIEQEAFAAAVEQDAANRPAEP